MDGAAGEGGRTVRIIMDRRAHGRTEQLLLAAEEMQQRHDNLTALLIAPYHQRAEYLASRAMERIDVWMSGEEGGGLDPARTIVEHAGDIGWRLRGGRLAGASMRPGDSHKVFAFVDDADDLGQVRWDRMMDDLTVNGIAVSAAVFTSRL